MPVSLNLHIQGRTSFCCILPDGMNVQHQPVFFFYRLMCSPQSWATLNSMMHFTVIQFRPTCCFTESGGKSMPDNKLPVRREATGLPLCLSSVFPLSSLRSLFHTFHVLWPDLCDSYFDLSVVTSCLMSPLRLMSLSPFECDFELLF